MQLIEELDWEVERLRRTVATLRHYYRLFYPDEMRKWLVGQREETT